MIYNVWSWYDVNITQNYLLVLFLIIMYSQDYNYTLKYSYGHYMDVSHHLVEIFSLCCVHHRHIVILFIVIFNQTLTLCSITTGYRYPRCTANILLISVAVNHCVASPLDIGTLEAGVKTNVKSGKFKFFLFSLYSTFCWRESNNLFRNKVLFKFKYDKTLFYENVKWIIEG
jgi:hypothetical protein